MMKKPAVFATATIACLLCLIAQGLAWELWLSPLRPGGSWLVLKVLPLLAPLRGLLHGKRYTYQWTSMLALLYVVEGSVRIVPAHGIDAMLAATELALSTGLFAAAIAYVRSSRI